MIWLASLTTAILAALAAIHALWTFEVWWPIREERRLVATVVGFGEATRMPGAIPCGLVAIFLTFLVVLIWLPQVWLRDWGLFLAALVFVIRGGLAYLPQWRRLTPQEPFARYDRRVYGPLCLGLGISLLILRGWTG